jgi:hypothetical protein
VKYPQAFHRCIFYPQAFHSFSTGYAQVSLVKILSYAQDIHNISTGYAQLMHSLSTGKGKKIVFLLLFS